MGRVLFYIISIIFFSSHLSDGQRMVLPKAKESLALVVTMEQNALSFADNKGFENFLPAHSQRFGAPSPLTLEQQRYHHRTYVFEFLFSGAVLLLGLFVLLLFLKSNERIYLYYFMFLASSLGVALINLVPYGMDAIPRPVFPMMAHRSLEAVTLFGLFSYCLFAIDLLSVRRQDARLAKWIISLAAITMLYGCFYWLFYQDIFAGREIVSLVVSRIVILSMSLTAIVWLVYTVHSEFKVYFLIGSVFYFTGALLAVLRSSAYDIPFDYFYDFSPAIYFQSGIFLEILCFSLALSHRVSLLNQARQKREETEKKKAIYERDMAFAEVLVARTQANPHFIFNNLNVIKYLIQSKQNDKAIRSLTTYSKFVRMLLGIGTRPQISLGMELDIVRYYLRLEANRLNKDFSYSINVKSGIDRENSLLPPMLLQSFVEQCLWQDVSAVENRALKLTVKRDASDTLILIENTQGGNVYGTSNLEDRMAMARENEVQNERIDIYNRNYSDKIMAFKGNKINRKGRLVWSGFLVKLTDKK